MIAFFMQDPPKHPRLCLIHYLLTHCNILKALDLLNRLGICIKQPNKQFGDNIFNNHVQRNR
jgi:hypothetical protein